MVYYSPTECRGTGENAQVNRCSPLAALMCNWLLKPVIFLLLGLRGVPWDIKARPGSGFYEIFCIFANVSCLCIHLVTLFNLPCKNIFVME